MGTVPVSALPAGSQVYWDVDTASIAVIAPNGWAAAGDPAQAARSVIATLQPWLRVKTDGLRFVSSNKARGRHYIHFERYVYGLRVVGGRFDVQIAQGRVVLIRADLHPGIELDVDPKLSLAQARRLAEDALSIGGWLARQDLGNQHHHAVAARGFAFLR